MDRFDDFDTQVQCEELSWGEAFDVMLFTLEMPAPSKPQFKVYTTFDTPTQLKFWEVGGDDYIGGIGYGNEIICGCCGGIVDPKEVYEFAPDDVVPIVVYEDYWVDISNEIMGD